MSTRFPVDLLSLLHGNTLPKLMGSLLSHEATALGIPPVALHLVDGNRAITATDDGIDALLHWQGNHSEAHWWPSNHTVWQYKAGYLSPAQYATEPLGATQHNGLPPTLAQALGQGASYVLVNSYPYTQKGIAARQLALENTFARHGFAQTKVRVIDAHLLAQWIGQHPTVANKAFSLVTEGYTPPIDIPEADAAGLQPISASFLETERQRQGPAAYAPQAFYGGMPKAQWWGVANSLVATKALLPRIEAQVQESLQAGPPLLAILQGSGGMGKSTLARLLAVRLQRPNRHIWWLDRNSYDDFAEQASPLLKAWQAEGEEHIIIADDWTKVPDPDDARKVAKKLAKTADTPIKWIVTTRALPPELPEDYWAGGQQACHFNFDTGHTHSGPSGPAQPTDQEALLTKVMEQVADPVWQNTAQQLLQHGQLAGIKPYYLLFLLHRTAQSQGGQHAQANSIQGIFEEVIKTDLELMQQEAPGRFAALLSFAWLHATCNLAISLDSFWAFARAFGENIPEPPPQNLLLREPWKYYLEASASPVQHNTDAWLAFHTNNLAETLALQIKRYFPGWLSHAPQGSTIPGIDEPTALRPWLHHGSQTTRSKTLKALVLQQIIGPEEGLELLKDFMGSKVAHHDYATLLVHPANPLQLETPEIEALAREFLAFCPLNDAFNRTLAQWLEWAFRGGQQRMARLEKLATWVKDLAAFTPSMLMAWIKACTPEQAIGVKQYIEALGYYNPKPVSLLLQKLPRQEAEAYAQQLMQEGRTQHHQVITKVLDHLPAAQATAYAQELATQPNMPHQVVCKVLHKLPPAQAQRYAMQLKGEGRQEHQVVNGILAMLPPADALAYARQLKSHGQMAHKEVLIKLLKILPQEEAGAYAEQLWLAGKANDKELACVVLQKMPQASAQAFAKHIFSLPKRFNDFTVLLNAAAHQPHAPEAITFIKEGLKPQADNRNGYTLTKMFQYNMRHIPEWNTKARKILRRAQNTPWLLSNLLPHYLDEAYTVRPACLKSLDGWQADIAKGWQLGKTIWTKHIVIALGHPQLRQKARQVAQEMYRYETEHPNFLTAFLYGPVKAIVEEDTYPQWDDFITPNPKRSSGQAR